MMRWFFALVLVAHGLVHCAIWLAPATSDAPFDVRRSKVLGDLGALATLGGVLAGAAFVLTGAAYAQTVSWWPGALLVAAGVSGVLMLLTFTKWWLLGLAIDLVLGLIAVDAVVRAS